MHRCTERQLYDIPRVSKRQRARRRFHARAHTHTYSHVRHVRTHPRARARDAHIICLQLRQESARPSALLPAPSSALSRITFAPLFHFARIGHLSLSLSFSLFSPFLSPLRRRYKSASFSLLRVSFPFPSISLMCKSLLLSPTAGCERVRVFLSPLYFTRRGFGVIFQKNFIKHTFRVCVIIYGKIVCELNSE